MNRIVASVACFAAAALLPAHIAADVAQALAPEIRVDKARLEAVEDFSESLANALLELSVAARRKDATGIARYFADDFEAEPLPCRPGALVHQLKWIRTHGWEVEPGAGGRVEGVSGKSTAAAVENRQMFLDRFSLILQHFSDIEDVRFKVKDARFDNPEVAAGDARLFFYIVGRDSEGHREWARATFFITAKMNAEKAWKITRWRTGSLSSDVADADIFSEVALPAGIARTIPAFGVEPNDGFVAHGGAAGDVNQDGLIDLVVTEIDGNRLFLNDGKGGFTDVSTETMVGYSPKGAGALILDYDNDGDADIFFPSVGNQVLLENRLRPDGVLVFRDVSEQAGVSVPAVGFSAAAADVNGDGLPDIYVACYNLYGTVMPNSWSRATNGTPNLLFINKGGRFVEAAREWGVDDRRWSYAAAFADVDNDGRPDLFVVNDFGEKALFINKADHFEDEAAGRGVLDPGNGMGVSFGDFDNDGDLDLHVTNMSSTAGNRILGRITPDARPDNNVLKKIAAGNTLFENLGNGYFKDVSEGAGYFSAGWAYGGGFLDFDNDGLEDEFTVNGFISGSTMNDT